MRSLGVEFPPIDDDVAVYVDIYTVEDGGQDDDGNPLPPAKTYYAQDARADVQPLSGQQRIAASGTTYAATHRLFGGDFDAVPPAGATVDVKQASGGEVVATYTVVYSGNWRTHLEIDLKGETS